MATKEEVESKLRKLILRADDADPRVRENLIRAVPTPRVIQMDVEDLGVSFWTQLTDGRLSGLHEGAMEQPDIRVTARSDHLVEMIDGKRNLFSSYLGGEIRIQASVSDLLAMRKLL